MLDGEYRVQFSISLAWKDPRLVYNNLKEFPLENIVDKETAEKIWIPPVRFPRLSSGKNMVEYDKESYVMVTKGDDGANPPYEILDESKIYKGAHSTLGYYRRFQGTHQCQFDLEVYPFDSQECSIQVICLFKKC